MLIASEVCVSLILVPDERVNFVEVFDEMFGSCIVKTVLSIKSMFNFI